MGLLETTLFASCTYFLSIWRGYHSDLQIVEFAERLAKHPEFSSHVCLLAVPFSSLQSLSSKISHPQIVLGCNSMHFANPGSFTESIAGELLQRHKAHFVLIGSFDDPLYVAERTIAHASIRRALEAHITPFFCIGETLQQLHEGKSADIIAEQCRQGLSGFSFAELTKVVLLYEAPWVRNVPEKFPLEKLSEIYSTIRSAIAKTLGEELFSKMRMLHALPSDIDPVEFIEHLPGRGYYTREPDAFMRMLEAKCIPIQEPFEVATSSEGEPFEPLLQAAEALSAEMKKPIEAIPEFAGLEEKFEEQHPEPSEPSEPPEPQTPKPSDEFEKPSEAVEEREETSLAIEAKEVAAELAAQEAAPLELAGEQKEASRVKEELEPEAQVLIGEEASMDEELPLPAEESSMPSQFESEPLPSSPPLDLNPTAQRLEELQLRVERLSSLDGALAECYQQVQEKLDQLPALKEQFPERLSKMTAELNQLDPALQEQINRGNIAFFTENPDKMKEASSVLKQIQEINILLQKTGAIPRDIDRLISKSREIRKDLDAEWNYFQTHRHELKETLPEFKFPPAPSQLQIKEPKVDLAPQQPGPSSLISKKVAHVKTPPLKH